jgi:KaiC/GvpD/RAD55 family RecA-like ATPase
MADTRKRATEDKHADTQQAMDVLQEIADDTVLQFRVDLSNPPQPPEWIDEPFIARGNVSLFAGREGEGKSLISQHTALRLATSGFKVLIVDVENGARLIVERLNKLGLDYVDSEQLTKAGDKSLAAQIAKSKQAAFKNIAVYTPTGFDFSSPDADDFMAFQEMIKLEEPDVVFVDSLRSMYGASLSSRRVGVLMELLRMVARNANCGIVVIHHTTKSGTTYLGSGAIGSTVEMVYFMLRHKDDPDPGRRVISCYKNRLTQEPEDSWLQITSEAHGDVLNIDPAEPFVPPSANLRDSLTHKLVAHLIIGQRDKGAPLNLNEIAAKLDRDPKDRTIRRILDALEEQGQVVKEYNASNRPIYYVPAEAVV